MTPPIVLCSFRDVRDKRICPKIKAIILLGYFRVYVVEYINIISSASLVTDIVFELNTMATTTDIVVKDSTSAVVDLVPSQKKQESRRSSSPENTEITSNNPDTSTLSTNECSKPSILKSSSLNSGSKSGSRSGSNRDRDHTAENKTTTRTQKSILLTKAMFFTFLIVVAAVAGGLIYSLIQRTEREFAITQFTDLSRRALKDCSGIVKRKQLSMDSMAVIMGQEFNNASQWPFVVVNGYEEIVDKLARAGSHDNMGE